MAWRCGPASVPVGAASSGEDDGLALALPGGELEACAGDVLDFGAQDAGRRVHGRTIQNVS